MGEGGWAAVGRGWGAGRGCDRAERERSQRKTGRETWGWSLNGETTEGEEGRGFGVIFLKGSHSKRNRDNYPDFLAFWRDVIFSTRHGERTYWFVYIREYRGLEMRAHVSVQSITNPVLTDRVRTSSCHKKLSVFLVAVERGKYDLACMCV